MLDLNSIEYLQTVERLEPLYGDAAPDSLRKVVDWITPKFCSGYQHPAFVF